MSGLLLGSEISDGIPMISTRNKCLGGAAAIAAGDGGLACLVTETDGVTAHSNRSTKFQRKLIIY